MISERVVFFYEFLMDYFFFLKPCGGTCSRRPFFPFRFVSLH